MDRLPSSSRGLPALLLLLCLSSQVSGSTRPDLPFIGCAVPEGNTQRCYFYVQEEKTWDEADKACRSHKDTHLATIPDDETRIFLSEAARPRHNGVWIGGKKEPQYNWRWNTGRPYRHKVVENRTEPDAELCGYVNSENLTVIQTTPCTTKLKYICSESELSSIHEPHYVSPYRHWIWYSAKIDCLNRGMDLVVLRDDNLDILRQLLPSEKEHEEDPRYWVGLSTSKYIWAKNRKEIEHILFGCGEPSHSTERCIEMLADSKYNDTRCEEKRPYICEWEHKGHEMFDIGCLGNRCFYYVEEPMSWMDANRTCRHYSDTFLTTIPDYRTQFYLNAKVTQLFLTKRKDQSAIMGRTNPIENGFWIGGRNIFYDHWRFMSGDIYDGDVIIENRFKDYQCGAVLPGNASIHGQQCNHKKRFLCLTTDPTADVLIKQNHFISSKDTQELDWLQARTNCLDRGMELASGSMDLMQQLLTGHTGSFWVGLTKSRFVWEHTGKPIDHLTSRNNHNPLLCKDQLSQISWPRLGYRQCAGKPIDHLTFRCGEPNNYEGRAEHCVQMWLDGEYNDALCPTLSPFVCEWDRQLADPSLVNPPYFEIKPPEPQDRTWMYTVIGIAAAEGVLILILPVLSVWIYKKYLAMKNNPAPDDLEMNDFPPKISPIELDNPDDPTLDDILSDERQHILLDALANRVDKCLRLAEATELWSILEANNVVTQHHKDTIRGNNNTKPNLEQVSGLFDHLKCGTNRRYLYFKAALLKADYGDIVRNFLDSTPSTSSDTRKRLRSFMGINCSSQKSDKSALCSDA